MPGLVPDTHVLLLSSGQKDGGWLGQSPGLTGEK